MHTRTVLSLLLVSIVSLVFCQSARAFERPWQQKINYRIDVTLAKDLRTITGSIDIEYINNSPDTLPVIYLKAFPNAIQPGSYADKQRRSRGNGDLSHLSPAEQGSLELRQPDYLDKAKQEFRGSSK